MVSATRELDIPVVIIIKHSRSHDGMWKLQTFRKWKSLYTSQHARHCVSAYGLRVHWKMNSLSLGISIPNTVSTEWSDIDTVLTAKNAQRLFSLGRYVYSVAFQRWVEEGHSKFATDSASATLQDESPEAHTGPEPDGNNFLPTDNHVIKDKQIAYPTEARER